MSLTTTTFTDSSGQVHGMYVPDNDFIGYTTGSLNSIVDSVTTAPHTYITTTGGTLTWGPTDQNQISIDYDTLQSIYNNQYQKQQAEQTKDRVSLVSLVRNRSNIFRSFMDSIRGFWMRGAKYSLPEREMNLDSKARVRYWSAKLFEPTKIKIEKFAYIKKLTNEETALEWVKLGSEHTVTPVGLDVWGTIGGFAQSGETIDWGKSYLTFIPGPELSKMADNAEICFTLAECFRLAEQRVSHDQTRKISV